MFMAQNLVKTDTITSFFLLFDKFFNIFIQRNYKSELFRSQIETPFSRKQLNPINAVPFTQELYLSVLLIIFANPHVYLPLEFADCHAPLPSQFPASCSILFDEGGAWFLHCQYKYLPSLMALGEATSDASITSSSKSDSSSSFSCHNQATQYKKGYRFCAFLGVWHCFSNSDR